jgi:soluble calcium-activated nucleotidase 1
MLISWFSSFLSPFAAEGEVLHRNSEWVKTVDRNGQIRNIDWGPIYNSLRTATNTSSPGYLWHEAFYFEPRHRQWIVLPRKASTSLYHPDADETMGTNLLLIASDDFSHIDVRRVGPLESDYGFTSVRKLPGTDNIFMALKVKELKGATHSKLCVFDLDGRLYLDNGFYDVGDIKYEGLEFLD